MSRSIHSFQPTDEPADSRIYRLLHNAETVCFVGDSLTEGTMNGGIPWYEPIQPCIRGKIFNISQGGVTAKSLPAYFLPSIVETDAELFVVAIGANDILFRDPLFCAMTSADYINNLKIFETRSARDVPTQNSFSSPHGLRRTGTPASSEAKSRRTRTNCTGIIRRHSKLGATIRGMASSTPTGTLPDTLRHRRRKLIWWISSIPMPASASNCMRKRYWHETRKSCKHKPPLILFHLPSYSYSPRFLLYYLIYE